MRRAVLLALAVAACSADGRGPPAPAPEPTVLRVADYNTWLLPLVADDLADRRARMPGAILGLHPDVVCLQEVWTEGDREELAAAVASELPHAAAGGGGLLTLSRHPIVSSRFVPFPPDERLHWSEQLARKGLLETVVATPAGEVRIVNSHLALARDPAQRGPRNAQLDVLLAHVDAADGRPVILAADLNTPSLEDGRPGPEYRRITETHGLRPVEPLVRTPDGGTVPREPTRRGWPFRPGRRGWDPDHVFFRSGPGLELRLRSSGRALDDPGSALSDHVLLLAEWELRPGGAAEEEGLGAAAAPRHTPGGK